MGALLSIDKACEVVEENKVWALPENVGPSMCMVLKEKIIQQGDGMNGETIEYCLKLFILSFLHSIDLYY